MLTLESLVRLLALCFLRLVRVSLLQHRAVKVSVQQTALQHVMNTMSSPLHDVH